MAKQRELGENIVNHGKTGRIKEKHRKIWENRGKQGESGENIEKHVETGRITGKHRKTRENRAN